MEGSQLRSGRSDQRKLETSPPVTAPTAEILSSATVDIIVHSLSADGFAQHHSYITSTSQLRRFLHACTTPTASPNQYLLSIEDISDEVIRHLLHYLGIERDAFEHHTKGRLNHDGTRQVESILHADKLVSTLLGRVEAKRDKYSLTWWKLSTHSLDGYTYEREALTESNADATKIVVPHFNVHISDTRRKVGSTKNPMTQVRSGMTELLRQWKKKKDEAEGQADQVEQTEEHICKLHGNTYRAHQVISDVKNDRWGTASEERLTYVKASKYNSTFDIFLFDKNRTLQENSQIFETDYTGVESHGILNSVVKGSTQKPTTRLIEEKNGKLMPTFLTRSEAEVTSGSAPKRQRRESRVVSDAVNTNDTLPQPAFDNSTRHRFLEYLSDQRLIASINSQDFINLSVRKIQLAFTRMIAKDWNLVLSQMGQTLDEIDRKMSDNNELRRNVLAWRRLLGSWRMTIIEYRAKLLETDQFLKSQMRQPAIVAGSTLSSAESTEDQISGENSLQSIHQSAERELEDILFSYLILTTGIKEIESRVDRSFHALMSSMSILESQKAISQGSAVARLTELAFIFIPLNFACTFFSMQITDFQGDSQPSIAAFFALALPLMLFLYGIRAFIRSSLLNNFKQSLETRIRETSKIPGTSEIPTRVIVSFGWQQLGPFSRALLVVVPIAIVVLVLIIELGQLAAFRITGSVVTILGTLTIIIFLAIESYVPTLQASAVVTWIISMLGITLGRSNPLNSDVMAALCTLVTTFFLIALAFMPPTISMNPKQRAMEILVQLWLIELPIVVICYHYSISNPRWELWVLLIGIFAAFIVFGIVVGIFELKVYKSFPELIALAAFSIGFPMAMVWSFAPLHGNHLPLYGAIIITFASVAIFFYLMDIFNGFGFSFGKESWGRPVFWTVLCFIVAIPITLVWNTLPSYGISVPQYAQISVTCGSLFLFAMFIVFVRPFSLYLRLLAFCLFWASTAAWLPALLWAGQIKAFSGLTQNRTNTIHVTWTSVIFWTVVWIVVSRIGGLHARKTMGRTRTM